MKAYKRYTVKYTNFNPDNGQQSFNTTKECHDFIHDNINKYEFFQILDKKNNNNVIYSLDAELCM